MGRSYKSTDTPAFRVKSSMPMALTTRPPAWKARVKSSTALVSVSAPHSALKVLSYLMLVAVRADHKPDGGQYTPAATPGSEDTAMIFADLIFPECISYGSTGSPKYTTEKIEVDSGAEQRNSRRAYPRHEYSINMDNIPSDEISQIMNLWHVCAGDFIGFMFLDPMDHTSLNTESSLSGSAITNADQFVASAIGSQSDYPIFKYYQSGNRDTRRRILYPIVDTLIVSVDGHEAVGWTYDTNDHVLRFANDIVITSNVMARSGASRIITGADFSALQPGMLIYIEGWVNAVSNAPPGGDPARVISASSTELKYEKYDGTLFPGTVASNESVTITQALPPTGAEIRCGYSFHVPVRFEDGDNMEGEIKQGMRESAFASFSRITLREVFE